MIIEVVDEAVDRGAPIGANRLLGILGRLFGWLANRDVIKAAPTAGVKKPGVERSRDRVLTDAEIVAVWQATAEIGWPSGPLVRMLLLTGQRRDEAAAASWPEIDVYSALWSIPGTRTKNGRPHHVQLAKPVLELLEDVPRFADGDFLFGAGGRGPFKGFGRAKGRLDKLAGIAPWTLHDLRRSCATGMASLGVPPHVIERILNHVSGTRGGIAGVYDRSALDAERRNALERWAEHVEKLVGGRAS
jgi:integrase